MNIRFAAVPFNRFGLAYLVGVKCGAINRLTNGRIEYSGQDYQSIASFICDEGHQVIGSNISVCDECGFWDPPAPICQGMSL